MIRLSVILLVLTTVAGLAQVTTGSWVAYPGQAPIYQTEVQQPVNADGSSSFKSNDNAVIPIKFKLLQGMGPLVFESIGSDSSLDNDYSYLSFTPSSTLTFSQILSLISSYQFTTGDCNGGALRWSVRVSDTQSIFIYYGTPPNFGNGGVGGCAPALQSGANLIGLADLRYDTTQIGGTFYDSYTNALTLAGSRPVIRASLVLDGGWAGDQRLTLGSATVNDNTFTPNPPSPLTPTCDLPPAAIKVTKLPDTGGDPVSIQPKDNNGYFRVVDCKYMYNLATSSLSGPGQYKVEVVIGGNPAPGAATFTLR